MEIGRGTRLMMRRTGISKVVVVLLRARLGVLEVLIFYFDELNHFGGCVFEAGMKSSGGGMECVDRLCPAMSRCFVCVDSEG